MTDSKWHVYLLLNDANTRTYVGATVSPDRRLRQHNKELVGGAKATSGDHWTRVCLISGFPDERAALQFEWTWKHLGRKGGRGHCLERRYKALAELLTRGKSSSTSQPFSSFPTPGLRINYMAQMANYNHPIFSMYVDKPDVDTCESLPYSPQELHDQNSQTCDQSLQDSAPACHQE